MAIRPTLRKEGTFILEVEELRFLKRLESVRELSLKMLKLLDGCLSLEKQL